MKVQELKKLVGNGKIFGVHFIKRTDGQMRVMSARVGVTPKEQSTRPRTWDPEAKGLLQVWDMNKNGYRLIPLEGITQVTVQGHTFRP